MQSLGCFQETLLSTKPRPSWAGGPYTRVGRSNFSEAELIPDLQLNEAQRRPLPMLPQEVASLESDMWLTGPRAYARFWPIRSEGPCGAVAVPGHVIRALAGSAEKEPAPFFSEARSALSGVSSLSLCSGSAAGFSPAGFLFTSPGHDWCVVQLGIQGVIRASTWTRPTSQEITLSSVDPSGNQEGAWGTLVGSFVGAPMAHFPPRQSRPEALLCQSLTTFPPPQGLRDFEV